MRDQVLTMSNRQALAVPVDANLGATDSTNEIPNPPVGENQPAMNLDTPLWWLLEFEENTAAAIQVEGTLNAELQFSLDGATWRTGDGVEVQLDDPSLAANEVATRRVAVGRRLRDELGETDLTTVRLKTVYTTTGRVMGDAAATVAVTSYLTNADGA